MKIQHGITSFVKGLMIAVTLLGLSHCAGGANGGLQMASTVPNSAYNGIVSTCGTSTLQGSLTSAATSGSIPVGATVTWQLYAGGCTNLTFTPAGMSPVAVINGVATYQRTYTTAATQVEESGTLSSTNSLGQVIASNIISSTPFSVGGTGTGISCQATAAMPSLSVPVTTTGQPLSNPPTDSFTVVSSVPIVIVSIQNLNGDFSPLTNPTSLPAAVSQTIQAAVPAVGTDPILFTVAAASNPSMTATCAAVVTVQTEGAGSGGVAPTCTLTLSSGTSVFAQGSQMILDLAVINGPAASVQLTVNGATVPGAVVGPNTIIAPSTSGSATATVISSSGVTNTCGVNFTVGTPVSTEIECDSNNKQNETCSLPNSVVAVTMACQKSNSACVQGTSWGVDPTTNTLWVSNGCRAEFKIEYLQ